MALPSAALAQQVALPLIGYLHVGSSAESRDRVAAFHRGLKELGFIEGRDARSNIAGPTINSIGFRLPDALTRSISESLKPQT